MTNVELWISLRFSYLINKIEIIPSFDNRPSIGIEQLKSIIVSCGSP
ncbi:hypothetical protein D1AOALGA4SA_11244 [Olavius algarvensis Delta 1 endosymbiont]|nr:hypothetical protein D1AOALGA4SA_11244 [Olavius algarvensis Delta 1 endosymbiont]